MPFSVGDQQDEITSYFTILTSFSSHTMKIILYFCYYMYIIFSLVCIALLSDGVPKWKDMQKQERDFLLEDIHRTSMVTLKSQAGWQGIRVAIFINIFYKYIHIKLKWDSRTRRHEHGERTSFWTWILTSCYSSSSAGFSSYIYF